MVPVGRWFMLQVAEDGRGKWRRQKDRLIFEFQMGVGAGDTPVSSTIRVGI
jgi:hypothetical protein